MTDPAQHGSVRAGGVFKYLVERYPERTPTLTHLYRQSGEEMGEVRRALGDLREGRFREAFATLERDGRIHRTDSADPYAEMIREWSSGEVPIQLGGVHP